MRRLGWLGLVLVVGCAESTAPRFEVVTIRCTLVQLPDGTVYDRCLPE